MTSADGKRGEAVSSDAVAKHQPVRSDAELLTAFRRQGDQAALAELIGRHHRLVLGVCQQLLGNSHDADDAYQATFLVLLRKSHRIRHSAALASWLYGVAFRVASRIRQRRARMKPLDIEQLGSAGHDPFEVVMLRDQQAALHAAIVRLPERLRRPVILRYLLGHDNLHVAQQLSISEAAVEGRLKRAKVRLRRQLTRQGMTMAAALATLPLAAQALEASERLIGMAVQRCMIVRLSGGSSAVPTDADAGMPGPLSNLVTEEIRSMLTRQLTNAIVVAGIGVAATGLAVLPTITQAQPGDETITVVQQDTSSNDPFSRSRDASGNETLTITQQDRADNSTPAVQSAPARSTTVTRAELSITARSSASERQILDKLEHTTRIDFFDEPLADAINFLAQSHGLQIKFKQSALDEVGITPDSATVNLQVADISLRSVLNLMLRDLGLKYMIQDEVLMITTREDADSHTFVSLYPYRSEWPIALDQLGDAIRTQIAPDTWDEVGGEGGLFQYQNGLMVSQTAEVHEQIVDLLMMLSQHAAQKPK